MEIKVAKTAGYCFGVNRAVETVEKELNKGQGPIYTYGPIIHNKNVVEEFSRKGVRVIDDVSKLPDSPAEGTIVIRSHGITKAVQDQIEASGLNIVDATCPFVKKIHRLVSEHSQAGDYILIIGDAKHPEVCGIRGWIEGDDVKIIKTPEEAEVLKLPRDRKICIVEQTTFNINLFQDLVEIIKQKGYDINVLNTICNATEERQQEARILAGECDAMIVIGDRGSSNTQKLFEICKKECENTYHIETSEDMDYSSIQAVNSVGITAGASTPNNIIQEVSKHVRKL